MLCKQHTRVLCMAFFSLLLMPHNCSVEPWCGAHVVFHTSIPPSDPLHIPQHHLCDGVSVTVCGPVTLCYSWDWECGCLYGTEMCHEFACCWLSEAAHWPESHRPLWCVLFSCSDVLYLSSTCPCACCVAICMFSVVLYADTCCVWVLLCTMLW